MYKKYVQFTKNKMQSKIFSVVVIPNDVYYYVWSSDVFLLYIKLKYGEFHKSYLTFVKLNLLNKILISVTTSQYHFIKLIRTSKKFNCVFGLKTLNKNCYFTWYLYEQFYSQFSNFFPLCFKMFHVFELKKSCKFMFCEKNQNFQIFNWF